MLTTSIRMALEAASIDSVMVDGSDLALDANAALFLGAVLGSRLTALRLAGGRMIDCAALRACPTLDFTAARVLLGPSDVAMLRGVLSLNPHLSPQAMLLHLRARERALTRSTLTSEGQALLVQALQQMPHATNPNA